MQKKHFIPVTRPTLEGFSSYEPMFKDSIKTGMLTTNKYVQALEEGAAAFLGVKHCIAVSSCTSGLMLAMKGLGLTGEVIMPSFTFGGSALGVVWNNLTPVFAEVDKKTWTLDPKEVEKLITPKTSAIFATHIFGVVCDVKALQALARKHKLKLIFDSAHAFGSTVNGVAVGTFGDVEVFSCSPIKMMTCAEGGIVATNNDELAAFVRRGRNYGDDGSNRLEFAGLSARMSEFHAAIGLRSLAKVPVNLAKRHTRAEYLVSHLKAMAPDLEFQNPPKGMEVTHYLLSVYIDPDKLGFTRDELYDYFLKHEVGARKCYPPVHEQLAFKHFYNKKRDLSSTVKIASRVLSVPLYSHMPRRDLERIVSTFKQFMKSRAH